MNYPSNAAYPNSILPRTDLRSNAYLWIEKGKVRGLSPLAGAYDTLGKSYAKIMKYIEDNKLEIKDYPRECYIDGIWNKDNVEDWLTEIQVPIK